MAKLLFGDRIGKNGKLRIGCSAVIFDEEAILLTRRVDNGQWCLPSGGVEPCESVKETCIREVKEETGLIIDPFRLIGIYSNPNVLIQYPDGNQVQLIAICFEAKINDGVLEISDETTEFGFFYTRTNTKYGCSSKSLGAHRRCIQKKYSSRNQIVHLFSNQFIITLYSA